MTRTTNARIAGVSFLLYIVAGIGTLVVFGRATAGSDIGAKLTTLAQHTTAVGVVIVLLLLMSFSALAWAVTLYAITRQEDPDLAMLAMICRVAEGVMGGYGISSVLALRSLAAAGAPGAADAAASHALGAYLMSDDASLTATFFAVGSTLFSYLLLRGRMIPRPLAWLGVAASVLLVIALPLQLAGFLGDAIAGLIWLPMLAFEVPLAIWFLTRGAGAERRTPARQPA